MLPARSATKPLGPESGVFNWNSRTLPVTGSGRPQRIRFLSGVPERAIGGQRRIMWVGVGRRGQIPLFDGDLCRRSVTAGLDSRLFSGKARDLEIVAE